MRENDPDELIGREVMIRSTSGIDYTGIVRQILVGGDDDEFFELGRAYDASYQRFVRVTHRPQQILVLPQRNEAAG
jgi:hypothetical protein